MTTKVDVAFPSLITVLTGIFTVAKLWGKIDWSWWWVISPIWISAIFALVIFIIALVIAVLMEWFK